MKNALGGRIQGNVRAVSALKLLKMMIQMMILWMAQVKMMLMTMMSRTSLRLVTMSKHGSF